MSKWIEKTLGEVTSYLAKGIPPKYVDVLSEDAIYVLNQKCNRNFVISYGPARMHDLSKKKVAEEKMLRPGDVLINSTGVGTAGRIAQIWDIPYPTTTDGHMITMRPNKDVDPLFYGYAIKAYQKQIETLAEGSTGQTELNKTRLQNEIIICFPEDKEEQYNIAVFLENIDKKITINEKINMNLYEQCQVIFSNMFESTEELEEWEMQVLQECTFQIIRGKSGVYVEKSKYANLNQKVNKGFILEKQHYKYLDESIDIPEEKFGRPRDIILNSLGQGTLGRVHFLFDVEPNVVIDQHITIIRTDRNKLTPEYLYFLLASGKYQNIINNSVAGSTGMLMLNISVVRNMKIPVPPIDLQNKFTSLVEPMYTKIEKNNLENEKLVALRDSLLPKLMSGELDVSDLDI